MPISDVASLVGGAALGAPFSEVFKLVIEEAKKVVRFKAISEDLASLMESLVPVINEIDSMQGGSDPRNGELKPLFKIVERVVVMVRKCSRVPWYDVAKKSSYTREINGIKHDLFSFCQIQVQIIQLRNQMHTMRPPASVRDTIQLPSDTENESEEVTIDIHLQGSSCDFLEHLGPNSETVKRPSSSSSSSDNSYEQEDAREEDLSLVFNTSPNLSSGSIITSWQRGQLLGRGSFGSVYEGISGDGDFFAFKEVSLVDQGSHAQDCIQQLEGEIALLSKLQHPNIVRYRGTAKDGSNLYVFFELVTQGSLLNLYQRYHLVDSVVSMYTRQILDGLKYLHDMDCVHRDIKCANILVDANGAVKLADFGLAEVSKFNDIKSCRGTPFWMAPEVINPKRTDGYGNGRSADIWSLGCTVLEMLTGQIPYCDHVPVEALYRIGRGVLPDIPSTLSPDARDFIIKCLKANPEQRPTAAELLNHPFVRRPLTLPGSGSGTGLVSASPLLPRI